jgi:hypothetical protein
MLSLKTPMENVVLKHVKVDHSYQRDVQRHHVYVEKKFVREAIGNGTVGRRGDGSLWWIDGLQRATGLLKRGFEAWWCNVYESTGAEFEALIFRIINGRETRKSPNQIQLFNAAMTEKEPHALAIHRAAAAAGLVIARVKCDKEWPIVFSPGLLLRAHKSYGEVVVTEALKLLVATWPQMKSALHQSIIGGVLMVVYHHSAVLDRAHFIDKVGKLSPAAVVKEVQGVQGGGMLGVFADQLLKEYNKGLPNKSKLRLFRDRKVLDAVKPKSITHNPDLLKVS